MKLNPYLGPRLWRHLLLWLFLNIKTQLNAKNQLVNIDSVSNFHFQQSGSNGPLILIRLTGF